MEKEFVPYDSALRLKNLGFDEPCFGFYYDDGGELQIKEGNHFLIGYLNAPLYQQAFRWFREKLKDSAIEPYSIVAHISYNRKITFEEAELACLEKLLEIVEQKQK